MDNEISRIDSESSILYELVVYSEWKQEPELPKIHNPQHEGLMSLLRGILPSPEGNAARSYTIEKILNLQQPWRLAVGDGGKVVAIIQEGSLEIRSSRDEYSSIIGKAGLPKDHFPQWRRWCWSPDCSILVIGFSNGSIRAYDLMGSNLFTILPEQAASDTRHALSACFFVQARGLTQKWSCELITVDYQGELRNFLVSPTEGFQESHSFSFNKFHQFGVTAVAYHPSHSLLFIAGPTGFRTDPSIQDHGSGIGLSAWRILNDFPFYQLVSCKRKHDGGLLPEKFWNRLSSLRSKLNQSTIIRLEVSPSAKFLTALHSCGSVSIWSIPSLRRQAFWQLQEQPGWNTPNPLNVEVTTTLVSGRKSSVSAENYYPIDIDWWSDEALVLSRNSGAVSVCEVSALKNLLGESPEFLAGAAQVKRFHNEKGFLALECETETISKNRINSDDSEDDIVPDQSDDESDERSASFFHRISAALSFAAYLVTDLERFRPKRKRLRLFRRTYRLLALRSTTPEELFSRKLDNEEYGEALTLAHTYHLDCDLVYQRQWRNSKVSVATIRDFLSKVSKQMWVLQECIERVPESLLAARELLDFGLKATCKDSFRSYGSKRKMKDVNDLTDKQRQMLGFRHTLLQYLDRLTTYEKILGGPQLADELFECTAYADFRSASSLRACVQFARAANCQAVECMLTYHGPQTQQHWLPILSNIPETICPNEYRSLLPECSFEEVIFPLQESRLRDLDWSEREPYDSFREMKLDSTEEDNECLYQFEPSLSAYRNAVHKLTPALVQQWYCERIRAIERSSRIVDNALALLHLAQDRNVDGLESLHQELRTLDALVYELHLEEISLEDLEKKSALEKCKLLMSKSSEVTFVSDLRNFLFPFLNRIEKEIPGKQVELLHDYFVGLASEDLVLPLKFFEEFLPDECSGVTPAAQVALAQACLYAHLGTNQLHLAQRILTCIPRNRETLPFCDVFDILEKELVGCLILHRNYTAKTLGYIRDNKNDVLTVTQLLKRMARTVAHSANSLSETVWSNLLKDILDLQQTVFTSVPIISCYEIFCFTLLSSGDLFSIKLAGRYLRKDLNSNDSNDPPTHSFSLPIDKSQALILEAAREYIDSSGSLTDPSMELALACLHLAQDETDEVKEELNLISSFKLLHEFGVKKLPLQVRLCSDRLRLIDECLKKKQGVHRNVNRLLQLAAYLSICGSDFRQRQGCVLVLVAETAFKVKDFRCCGEVCQSIVDHGYAAGWKIVSQLGCCCHFNDLSLRSQLLAFALQHCPSECLQELLEARRLLEIESLQLLIKRQLTMHNAALSAQLNDPVPSVMSDSTGGDFLQTLQVGEIAVRETTQLLLSRVGDSQFWKKAFHLGWNDETNCNSLEQAVSRDQYACHAFYLSLYESLPITASALATQYDCFAFPDIPSHIQLEQALLQVSLMEQGYELEGKDIASILIECAYSLLPEDNCLGLAHLLAVPEHLSKEACDHVFGSKLSTTNFKLAQYFAALCWYRSLVSGNIEKLHDVFHHDPDELIEYLWQEAKPCDAWSSILRDWRLRLTEFQQGQDLLHLDCGIDVHRFSNDEQYRRDSILGLALSDEKEKLNFALTLASRYNINRGEVIAEHVASLLLSSIPAPEVRQRIKESDLIRLISEASSEIKTKLESSVVPNLHGTHIEYLELCFEILNQIAPGDRICRLLPKDHLKLLSKVNATSTAINYKLLISGPKHTWQAIESSLTVENIALIAKLLKALPSSLVCHFTSSQLCGYLIRKHLYDHNLHPSMDTVYLLLQNMKSEDIIDLIKGVCFTSDEEASCLPYQVAEDILKEAVVCCRKMNDIDSVNVLEVWKAHVQKSKYLSIRWPQELFCRTYFLSQGESDTLLNLVHSLILNTDKSVEFIVDCMDGTNVPSLQEIITDLLKKVLSSFKEHEANDWQQLSTLLVRMEQLISSNSAQSCIKEWESLLHAIATHVLVPPELHLKALHILQVIRCEETEGTSLLWPHTRAIVASAWPQVVMQPCDVEEEEKRVALIHRLLSHTNNWQQRDALHTLLLLWPKFSHSYDSFVFELMYQVLLNCIKCDGGKWSEQKASYIFNIFENHSVNFDCMDKVLLELKQEAASHSDEEDDSEDEQVDVQVLMLVCLLCEDSKAHSQAVTLAQHHLMGPLHDKVAKLVLSRKIAVDLISTPAYSDLLSFILKYHPEESKNIIDTLLHRKYIPEAGAMILRSVKGIPRFMHTFSASLMTGLGKCDRSVENSVSHSAPELVHPQPEDSKVKCSPSDNQTSAALPQDNDWNVSDEAWLNVDEVSMKLEARNEEECRQSDCNAEAQLVTSLPQNPPVLIDLPKQESSSDIKFGENEEIFNRELSEVEKEQVGEGWGGWSDDEPEFSPQKNPAGNVLERTFLSCATEIPISPTLPSFLPSSRSAFVRVPPRDQVLQLSPTPHTEKPPLDQKTASYEGWSDSSDENWNW